MKPPQWLWAIVIGFALGVIVRDVFAWDLYAQIHGTSVHADRRPNGRAYNAANYGAGIEARQGDFAVGVGGYRNSIDRTSAYMIASYTPIKISDWSLGASAGIVSGYEDHVSPVAAVTVISPEYGRVSVQIVIVPVRADHVVPFSGISMRVKL